MTLTPIEHDWDRIVRLGKDVVQYLAFMGMFVGGTGLCVYGAIAVNKVTPELHELALKGLFAVGGGILGYFVKKEK